ncbi:hypothetical protein [Bacteroides sp. An19]|uniref:hypothetical protein n=1 Tax=Bacteroides sp. An19 TaxID=1965580 RepID=UPI000B36D798|nr:hypothetical protein [Bacteroides sp. An19]OUP31197.1 hypothetical protein B5F25_11950 [Bacteroides sp. An19]
MEFNFKMRLLGYYNTDNQRMNEENFRKDDAKVLASLFDKTFANIPDNADVLFAQALRGHGVFIFRDNDYNLYAYYPYEHIARITEVRYSVNAIIKASPGYKKWFVPGEPFVIEQVYDNNVLFYDLSKNEKKIRLTEKFLYKSREDYYIKLGNSEYAIKWNGEISISEMKKLILHRWTCLDERRMKDYCGNCDGWDYSGCDMERCREDCEGCGGRRYKCNNSCFYHRHSTAIVICYIPELITEELNKAIELIKSVMNSSSEKCLDDWQYDVLCSLRDDCDFIQEYLNVDMEVIDSFRRKFSTILYLHEHKNAILVEVKVRKSDEESVSYLLPLESISVSKKVGSVLFVFKNIYMILSLNGYDCYSNANINETFSLVFDSNEVNRLMKKMKERTLRYIHIEDSKYNFG